MGNSKRRLLILALFGAGLGVSLEAEAGGKRRSGRSGGSHGSHGGTKGGCGSTGGPGGPRDKNGKCPSRGR